MPTYVTDPAADSRAHAPNFNPAAVDWTDIDNYFRCRYCGMPELDILKAGDHKLMICDTCGTGMLWLSGNTTREKRTEAEYGEALTRLSGYRILMWPDDLGHWLEREDWAAVGCDDEVQIHDAG